MKSRRILGSPNDSPDNLRTRISTIDPQSPTPVHESKASDRLTEEINCPICNEPMINLYQLNQHIDDVHGNNTTNSPSPANKPGQDDGHDVSPAASKVKQSPIHKLINNDFQSDVKKWFDTTPTKRKTINLDLFDGDKGFSISDNNTTNGNKSDSTSEGHTPRSASSPLNKPRIIRSHWKHPPANPQCKLCHKPLNVKYGMVNCRRCGDLFCNDHTNYKIKLRNPTKYDDLPHYDKHGIWCKCCETCYFNKPDLVKGTDVNVVDLTTTFQNFRIKKIEENQLIRDKLIKRYIKIVNFLSEYYLHNKPSTTSALFHMFKNEDDEIIDKQREIIGFDNWQNDAEIHHCYICFTKFNFLIRKHHCRICGKIVCDDKFEERKDCSLLVPLPIILKILSNLNYSKFVQTNFDTLMHHDDIQIRICKNCKNDLTFDYKLKLMNNNDTTIDNNVILKKIFQIYNQLLIIKNYINHYLPKYEQQLLSDINIDTTTKLKDKIMYYLKEYEKLIYQFKHEFYSKLPNNNNEIKPLYAKYIKLINGINQSLVFFLQDNLIKFKDLNTKFKDIEHELLPKSITSNEVEMPKLTKRQIRELREQLMVMNEQKFIIENLINDVTKQRKFDELQPLLNNKQELLNEIEKLEEKLGEFGF